MDSPSSTLEHLGSPIPSEIERELKKVRNKDLEVNSLRNLNMEDLDHGRDSIKEILLSNVGYKDGGTEAVLEKEDLDILDDDVRVSLDGPYLKIFFLTGCKKCWIKIWNK